MDQFTNATQSLYNVAKDTTSRTVGPLIKYASEHWYRTGSNMSAKEVAEKLVVTEVVYRLPPNMHRWIAIGGIMGASAVAIGAYGAHVVYPKDIPDSRKAVFEVANKYHFIHSLALLAVPFVRKPMVTGTLFVSGIVLFSGTCYYHALTQNMEVRQYTPYGGMALIFAWLSMTL